MAGENPIPVAPINPSIVPAPNVGVAGSMVRVGINGPYVFSANGILVAKSLSGNTTTTLITG